MKGEGKQRKKKERVQSLSSECALFDLPRALSLLHCMTQQLSAGVFCSSRGDERMNRGKGRDGTIRAKHGREYGKLLGAKVFAEFFCVLCGFFSLIPQLVICHLDIALPRWYLHSSLDTNIHANFIR